MSTGEEIETDLLYKVGNSYYVLGECKTQLDQFSNHCIFIDGYADIKLESWLNVLDNYRDKSKIKIIY